MESHWRRQNNLEGWEGSSIIPLHMEKRFRKRSSFARRAGEAAGRAPTLHRSSGRRRDLSSLSHMGSVSRCKPRGCVRLGLPRCCSTNPAAGEASGAHCLFVKKALNL